MEAKTNRGATIIMAVLFALFFASSFLLPAPQRSFDNPAVVGWILNCQEAFNYGTLSSILAAASIIVCCFILLKIKDRFFSEAGLTLPVVYLFIISSNPETIYFSPLHSATPLLFLSIYYFLSFKASEANLRHNFICFLSLALASFFYPPFALLFPALTALNYKDSGNKGKYFFTAILSFLIPFALAFTLNYLTEGIESALSILAGFASRVIEIPPKTFFFPTLTALRIFMIFTAAAFAAVDVIKRLDHFKILKFKAIAINFGLIVIFAAVAVIFSPDIQTPSSLYLGFPLAILLSEYIPQPKSTDGKSTVLTILLLVSIAERIMHFV